MDIQSIIQAIPTLGFPIVCCFAMGWYIKYTTDKSRDEISNLNQEHRNEINEITQAINNNTLALTKLCDYIQGAGDK